MSLLRRSTTTDDVRLVNHGISNSLVEKMKSQLVEFYNLPMEEKKKPWQYPGDVEGFGQTFVVSEEQKLAWSDMFYLVTHPTHLRKPHLLPKFPLPFSDSVGVQDNKHRNIGITLFCLGTLQKAASYHATQPFGRRPRFHARR